MYTFLQVMKLMTDKPLKINKICDVQTSPPYRGYMIQVEANRFRHRFLWHGSLAKK